MKSTKDKIGSAYEGIDTGRNKLAVLHYPVYIMRRFLFVHIYIFTGAKYNFFAL